MNPGPGKPLVGVIGDMKLIAPHHYHVAGDKYLRALALAADVVPVIIPSLQDIHPIKAWTDRLDGVFLTGAYSMVDPAHYDETRLQRPYEYDAARDQLSFQLISAMLEADLPLFAACRGMQELNVALGGSLHQAVHEVDGLHDHREDKSATLDQQYGPAHNVALKPDGLLNRITGLTSLQVNSLHTQGINRLADGLSVEAIAEDGMIEAVQVPQLRFGLAVQWHPEWKVDENPIQAKLYRAFGEACRH